MSSEFSVVNIKEMLAEEDGEHMLHLILSDFSCPINPDVERFLLYQSIDFAKRNQSVTYLVLEKKTKKLVAYFTLAIKSISVKTSLFSRTICKRIERVSVINEQTGEYNLAAYLIAQLGKNFKDGMNERISGERLLQSAIEKYTTCSSGRAALSFSLKRMMNLNSLLSTRKTVSNVSPHERDTAITISANLCNYSK